MIPFDFAHERPESLEAAVAALARRGDGAKLLAGGTDLLPNMRVGYITPAALISLGAIAPQPPRLDENGAVRIDALMRLSNLVSDDLVRARLPMVAEAAHVVAGYQIRQMGTLGGNLCQETRCLYLNQKHEYQFVAPCYKRGGDCCYPFPRNTPGTCWSIYKSDIAPALIALDARIEILGEAGLRAVDAGALFTGNAIAPFAMEASEILRAVLVPAPAPRRGWGYRKVRPRGGLEFAMLIVAATVTLAEDGRTCEGARIVLGAVGQGPVRPAAAEAALAGAVLDDTRIAAAAEAASREITPLPHSGFTTADLREAIRIHLRAALEDARTRAHPEQGGK